MSYCFITNKKSQSSFENIHSIKISTLGFTKAFCKNYLLVCFVSNSYLVINSGNY